MENINCYFENLGKLNFTSARNYIKLISVEENIPSLFEFLNQIVNLEKNYYHLIFITYKQSGLLSRKKQNESFVEAQLQLEEIKKAKKNNKCDIIVNYLLRLLIHRCKMIEFYRNLKLRPGVKISDNLLKLIEIRNALKQEFKNCENNPLLQLLDTMNLELDVIFGLLDAHDKTTNLYFLEPLNSMQSAVKSLNELDKIHHESEMSTSSLPLINWLKELNRFVFDKYTLYFQPILSRYTILSIGYSPSPDSFPLIDKIRQFACKFSPCSVTILFDTTKQVHAYTGHGYVLPLTQVEPLIGLQNYQAIFSTSTTQLNQDELFLTVSLIREKIDVQPNKKIAHLIQTNSTHKSISFFVSRLETRTYLSLIFSSHKTEKDRQILSFVNEISNELQGIRLLEQLKIE